jgi:phosphate/phosphite/phosphonate ABC transporter binding protein
MLRRYALSFLVLCGMASPARAETKGLVFGLQRTVSDAKAQEQSAVLEGYLSEALKRPVKARTYATYDELADDLAKGAVDIAWINPLAFVRATQTQPGIQAVAKALRHGATYQAVVFVKAGSPAANLSDLKGLKAAWVDKDSAAGYLYPRAMFIRAGETPDTFFGGEKFYGTHEAVCQAVLSGEAGFGATFETGTDNATLRVDGCTTSLGEASKDKFRAIAASDPIPNEVVAVRSGFDADTSDALGAVFGQMTLTDAGKKILADVFNADGFGAALETDFNTVRSVLKTVASTQVAAAPPAAAPAEEPKAADDGAKKKPVKKDKKKAKTAASE